MNNRRSGFFWVRINTDSEWVVSEWSEAQAKWFFAGTLDFCFEADLAQINETPLLPPKE